MLYTAEIRGDLALLPRLHTFLDGLRRARTGACLLLDLGGACCDDVWHCRATGNRSTLVVLDGMGYDAVNIAGALTEANRAKLAESAQIGLVDEARDWVHQPQPHCRRIIATLRAFQAADLQVLLAPARATRLAGNRLTLARVGAGQVGAVALDLASEPALISARIHNMPPGTPPNPTIAGAVDFVLSEARLFQTQQGSDKT